MNTIFTQEPKSVIVADMAEKKPRPRLVVELTPELKTWETEGRVAAIRQGVDFTDWLIDAIKQKLKRENLTMLPPELREKLARDDKKK